MNSLYDILNEHNYVYTLAEEYYKHIDRYKNQYRESVPIRYLSINTELSVFDKNLDSVYQISDKLLNGLIFDVYELVPTKYTSPISPQLLEDETLTGLNYNLPPVSITLIGTLTPDKIHLNDLVQFYGDLFNKAVFQVFNIRTPLFTNVSVPIFELDLTNTSIPSDSLYEKVRVNKIYIYDLSQEKFVEYEQYKNKYKLVDIIENKIVPLINNYFDYSAELYKVDNNYYPYEINKLIYDLISDVNINYFRIHKINIPANIELLQLPENVSSDINTTVNLFKLSNPLSMKFQYEKSINVNEFAPFFNISDFELTINEKGVEYVPEYIDSLLSQITDNELARLYILSLILDYLVRNYVHI
jgi:hypothetical protein